ncbi:MULTISPECIES: hypothetical protein [unclassified Enterococcus]|uniref:hypothetical protein n=1 Tax=unclassified Enterococcus TaxID=2608891 RepID=UPI0015519C3F|nr:MULTISPECIES: hypothetical protein [unclassified Enterococcus]MBS7575958.1 hypothetical protein [Enterococcus sp. MMGLQ5-2]MBS7583191.1 hypothetical protein [Enterococcus sp. MMGLQ5-1]NPD11051.1 hypothetical protein [Enterococcus sp. MMGLQ5-1]NPD35794.1 hypothetical protein [Enterococcus sp. MMGLQ5-2]
MLMTLSYLATGGLILFLIESLIIKKKGWDLDRFHQIIGTINLCLVIFFLMLYLLSPDLFSSDVKIKNQFIYICFTILASYYYFLAAPLSIASSFVILKTSTKNNGLLYLNVIASLLLIISFRLFL